MRTGLLDTGDVLPVSSKELLICFMCVFYRQCFSKAFLFSYHNGIEDINGFNDAIIRGLKYGSLSANGVGAKIKPFVALAMQKGYLTNKDCKESAFATKALAIYPTVHQVFLTGGEAAAKGFALSYGLEMLQADEFVLAEEAQLAGDLVDDEEEEQEDSADCLEQIKDSAPAESITSLENANDAAAGKDEEKDEQSESEEEEIGECDCDFCVEMRGYDDLDLANLESADPFQQIMVSGLLLALGLAEEEEEGSSLSSSDKGE